jgi:hypothetical protein
MSSSAYVGTAKRTFKQAIVHLLQSEYAILGSDRVVQLLASDIEQVAEQFYPKTAHLSSGWMVLTGTKATGGKAYPGQPVSDHQLVTIAWPVTLPQDIQAMAAMPKGKEGKEARHRLLRQRVIRLVEHGWSHELGPVLLTLADLSIMLGLSTVESSKLLTEARQLTGKSLPTMGYYFDQGMRPSHKGEIIALYEQGMDEAEIAFHSQHAQSSVGRYIRDYERVKLSVQRDIPVSDITATTGLQPSVVAAYFELVCQYHPDLQPVSELAHFGA